MATETFSGFINFSQCRLFIFYESRGGWIGLMVLGIVFLLLLFYWFKNYLPVILANMAFTLSFRWFSRGDFRGDFIGGTLANFG
jgi:hypothetical protein